MSFALSPGERVVDDEAAAPFIDVDEIQRRQDETVEFPTETAVSSYARRQLGQTGERANNRSLINTNFRSSSIAVGMVEGASDSVTMSHSAHRRSWDGSDSLADEPISTNMNTLDDDACVSPLSAPVTPTIFAPLSFSSPASIAEGSCLGAAANSTSGLGQKTVSFNFAARELDNSSDAASNETPVVTASRGIPIDPHDSAIKDPPTEPTRINDTQQGWHFDVSKGTICLKKQRIEQVMDHADAGQQTSPWQALLSAVRPSHRQSSNSNTSSGRWGSGGGGGAGAGADAGERTSHCEGIQPQDRVYRIRAHTDGVGIILDANLSTLMNEFIRWTFRVSFMQVGLVVYFFFCLLIFLFGICIYGAGRYEPACVTVSGYDYTKDGMYFMDAMQMSWTTLSTVGYGVIAPSLATDPGEPLYLGINILAAFESFVGVLFAAIVGSIIFSKVARVQSIAQVKFSDPILVRYGTGVIDYSEDQDCGEGCDEDDRKLPCPVLEFRVINELSNTKGGEILDANVSVVGVTLQEVDESDRKYFLAMGHGHTKQESKGLKGMVSKAADTTLFAAAHLVAKGAHTAAKGATHAATSATKGATHVARKGGAALFGASHVASHATGNMIQRLNHTLRRSTAVHIDIPDSEYVDVDNISIQTDPESDDGFANEFERRMAEKFAQKIRERREHLGGVSAMEAAKTSVTVDEGNSSLVPPQVYHKLEMEADRHPFFKRVWNIRHRLDENSPLLSARARHLIADNDGFWPEELNDYKKVREHLRFSEIIVNFSGTANVSGSSVFDVKVYHYADLNIGYSFVLALGKSEDGRLIADIELLNDVVEQPGGGGEPFTDLVNHQQIRNVLDAFQNTASESANVILSTAGGAVDVIRSTAEGASASANEATLKAAAILKSKLSKKELCKQSSDSVAVPSGCVDNMVEDTDDEKKVPNV